MSLPERRIAYPEDPVRVEDRTLFRTSLVRITVEVTPERRRSSRGDLILRGYVAGKEIEVVFPGRRHAAAVPLLHRLQQILQRMADRKTRAALAVRIDGCWRVRMVERDGLPDRHFQLVAARWQFRGPDGREHLHGELPLA
jgi:hypothetical protein